MILAGVDARPITPALDDPGNPVWLAGFQSGRRASAIAADLTVRSLAVAEAGRRPVVLSVVDLIGLLRIDTLDIRRRAEVDADVVVASTHTHSGPDTIGLWGPAEGVSGVNLGYLDGLRGTVVASIRAAVDGLEPAVIRAAATEVRGVIRNLRTPELVDRQVSVVGLDRPDGSTIASLVNVGVHPEVLDGASTLVSPDLAGAARLAVERARGGTAVWVSGDLGGMQSPEDGPRTLEETDRKGLIVAEAALAALETAEPRADASIRYRSTEVPIPLWNPRFKTALDGGLIRGTLAHGSVVTEVAVLDLGAARAACWPGEVLPSLGLRSKERLAADVPLLIGLANDEIGYVLADEEFGAPEDWDDPGPRYEESMSVAPDAGSRLLSAIDWLLGDLPGNAAR